MSIEDFDNDAPDNRSRPGARLADAARFDERRKIWKACGMDGDPPEDIAKMVAMIRAPTAPAAGDSAHLKGWQPTYQDWLDERDKALADAETAREWRTELDEVRRVLAAGENETTMAAAERTARAEISLSIQVSDLRARLGCAGEPGTPGSFSPSLDPQSHAAHAELKLVYEVLTGREIAQDWDLSELRRRCHKEAGHAREIQRIGGPPSAERTELDEVRRALNARDGESAFEALGRSRDEASQAQRKAQRDELAEIYGILTQADAPWSDLARLRQECRDAARSASTARSLFRESVASARRHLAEIYTALTGDLPIEGWEEDALIEDCVRVIHNLASVEPELHEDVTAYVVGDVALRFEPLARAVVRLLSLPDPTPVCYLRLDHDGGADWYQESSPPHFGLSEDLETQLSTRAIDALAAGDGAAYLDVLRQVADQLGQSA